MVAISSRAAGGRGRPSRAFAAKALDAAQARRLLAIALVLDGASRGDAARQTGMDRQTLRDWVHRYNEAGLHGLLSRKPPGARAKAHYHKDIETIAYLLDGECAIYFGDGFAQREMVHAGEHVFCPANLPHAPSNESGKPCTWLVVHSSGSDQDGIVLLPDLDAKLAKMTAV